MTTRIDQFSPGAGHINTWIVGDDEEVIVIDPGSDAAGLLDAVGDREVLAVICTHGLNAIGEDLLTLPADTRVLPGHGLPTTIAMAEKQFDSWIAAGPAPSSLGG